MSEMTGRLALPMIAPGQAQKEMTHNEALTLLDIAVQPCVVEVGTDAPPAAPLAGQCWIVGAAPTGAWAGHPGALAGWTGGGWRFLAPREGMAAWIESAAAVARRVGGTWRVGEIAGNALLLDGIEILSTPVPAIAPPAGGGVVDAPARAAIAAILAALEHHGLALSG